MSEINQKKSFGAGADRFLEELYTSVGADTTQKKIKLLEIKLDGMPNFYAFGGQMNDEMKLACLEYEYLIANGKIDLVLA